MFKYEMHCHSIEGSKCSKSSGAEIAEAYKKLGYDGVVITDHFFNGNCAVSKRLSWEERVEEFMKGYENAKKRGDEIGIKVFFGFESNYGGTEILVYGLDKKWLLEHPYCHHLAASELSELAHRQGALVVQAHPFREASYIEMIRLLPRDVDAVEAINSSRPDSENNMGGIYADNYGLIKVVGSDNHNVAERKVLGVLYLDEPADSIEDLIKAIKENRHKTAVETIE